MKPLLEVTDIRYLRRLVRELNQHGMVNGFTAKGIHWSCRCNRARLHKGEIHVRAVEFGHGWFEPISHLFIDSSGGIIVARRAL